MTEVLTVSKGFRRLGKMVFETHPLLSATLDLSFFFHFCLLQSGKALIFFWMDYSIQTHKIFGQSLQDYADDRCIPFKLQKKRLSSTTNGNKPASICNDFRIVLIPIAKSLSGQTNEKSGIYFLYECAGKP